MTSIFFRGIKTNTPWYIERTGTASHPRDIITDSKENVIAEMSMPVNKEYSAEQYKINRSLIGNAPRILAALLEATYTLHEMGIYPSDELRKLIKDSGGPDLGPAVELDKQTNKSYNKTNEE